MNMADDVTFRVFRGEPDSEGVPTGKMVDYTVEMDEGMVVLDVIHRIQAEHAPELVPAWIGAAPAACLSQRGDRGGASARVHDTNGRHHGRNTGGFSGGCQTNAGVPPHQGFGG